MKKPHSGFTLIELLIVVAIIAILAAIAVPNFLEAQTRAKTSRVLADMRTVKTALEAYQVDYSVYPLATTGPNGWNPIYYVLRYKPLTTPIAYITSPPQDAFGDAFAPDKPVGPRTGDPRFPAWPNGDPVNPTGLFDYWPKRDASRGYTIAPYDYPSTVETSFEYQLRSYGPDLNYDGNTRFTEGPLTGVVLPYDPTNGTVSDGDIIMWGPGSAVGSPFK